MTSFNFKSLFTEVPLESFFISHKPPFWCGVKLDGECWIVQRTTTDKVHFKITNMGVRSWTEADLIAKNHQPLLDAMTEAITQDGTYIGEVIVDEGKYDKENQVIAFNKFQRVVADGRQESRYGKLRLMLHDLIPVYAPSYSVSQPVSFQSRQKLLRSAIHVNEHVQIEAGIIAKDLPDVVSFFELVASNGYEGIVIKPLYSNLTDQSCWLKMKVLRTRDAVIFAMAKTDGLTKNGFSQAYLIGMYNPDGSIVYLNKVGTGLTLPMKKALTKTVLANKTSEDSEYIYCKPTQVVEIAYQDISRSEDGSLALRFPRILRFRPDKLPSQCPASQLSSEQFTNTLARLTA